MQFFPTRRRNRNFRLSLWILFALIKIPSHLNRESIYSLCISYLCIAYLCIAYLCIVHVYMQVRFSFLSSSQSQWSKKLSGSWKASSPVVSAMTPTLNPNCCSAFTCSANSVWSDFYIIARDGPFTAPAAAEPPSSLQLVFQASKLHFTSITFLKLEML